MPQPPTQAPAQAAAQSSAQPPAQRSWADDPEMVVPGKRSVPEGVFIRCPECGEHQPRKAIETNLWVCTRSACQYHFRVTGVQRVAQLVDENSFEPMNARMAPQDPLNFVDLQPYADRIKSAQKKTGQNDGVHTGRAFIKGRKVILAVMDFTFLGGSMGSVIGEKITLAIEAAGEQNLPLIIVSASGGARMMESGYSLMQMAKTSAALARFDEQGGLYISILTDPTTGGVTASFAMLGDVILAEPRALIGFAGPRVIRETIRKELPEGFQRSEFLLNCGFVDRVVPRSELRSEISSIIDYAGK